MFTQIAPMIISLYILTTSPSRRQDLLDVLRSIVGPTIFRPGCITSRIFQNPDNSATFLLYEEWNDARSLENHFATSIYYRLLSAMELCITKPDVVFIDGNLMRGMEWVEEIRAVDNPHAKSEI
jgi:quinol monooxygenase YgiN